MIFAISYLGQNIFQIRTSCTINQVAAEQHCLYRSSFLLWWWYYVRHFHIPDPECGSDCLHLEWWLQHQSFTYIFFHTQDFYFLLANFCFYNHPHCGNIQFFRVCLTPPARGFSIVHLFPVSHFGFCLNNLFVLGPPSASQFFQWQELLRDLSWSIIHRSSCRFLLYRKVKNRMVCFVIWLPRLLPTGCQ